MDPKRTQRCCFTGHRPEKLKMSETDIRAWLDEQIDRAIADGLVTFITGCAMGVDIWAAQIVMKKRELNRNLHLIAATPYPGFGYRWKEEWKEQYHRLLKDADLVRTICDHYTDDCFSKRNHWIVDHSCRVIALYNGEDGGTKETIDYALQSGIEVVQLIPGKTDLPAE